VERILGNHESLLVEEIVIKDAFVRASEDGQRTVVDLFIQLVPGIIKTRYWEALHGAAQKHQWQIMDRILTTPWSASFEDRNTFHASLYLASYGHKNLLRAILLGQVKKVDMKKLAPTILVNAVDNGAVGIVSEILKYSDILDMATVG
jgi:hypothetical protein